MDIFCKENYEAPSTTVVDLKFEGLICQSPGGVGGRDGYTPDDDNPFGN